MVISIVKRKLMMTKRKMMMTCLNHNSNNSSNLDNNLNLNNNNKRDHHPVKKGQRSRDRQLIINHLTWQLKLMIVRKLILMNKMMRYMLVVPHNSSNNNRINRISSPKLYRRSRLQTMMKMMMKRRQCQVHTTPQNMPICK